MKNFLKNLFISTAFLLAFILWTLFVSFVDRAPIGPLGSPVGLSAINGGFHRLTGVHLILYYITDWAGLVPIFCGFCFALLGLWQWIRRKGLFLVDRSILALGIYYIIVIAAYLLFEEVVINYRPVLINGYLEASYPSSTTLLVLAVMPTVIMQLKGRLKSKAAFRLIEIIVSLFCAFMVLGRLLSGVHWLSDIIGGVLLAGGLVFLYRPFAETK